MINLNVTKFLTLDLTKLYDLFPIIFNIEITTGQVLVVIGAVIIGVGIALELRDIRNGPRNNPQPKEPA